MTSKRDPRRGAALLAVLWLTAALSAIAFSIAGTVRSETERAATNVEDVKSQYLAQGGIERALLHMQWGPQYTLPDGSSLFYRMGQPAMELDFPEGHVTVEVIPEASRLSLNQARPEVLDRLLLVLGATPEAASEIAAAIVDWRNPSPDGQLTVFDQYYLSLTPSFRSRHASFLETEELLLLRGITPDLYYGTYIEEAAPNGKQHLAARGGLRDCVSAFGSLGPFDANTVAPAVLLSAGVPPEDVMALVQRRTAQPFVRSEELQAAVSQQTLPLLRLGGNSMYLLRATARMRLPDGKLSDLRRTVAARVKFQRNAQEAYQVLRWYDRG
jgi:general secretion pathway protein K